MKKIMKKLKIIIIVLIVIIIGLGTFITVNKFLLEDNSKNKEGNPSSTNRPIPSESPKPTQREDIQEPEEKETEISMELAEELYNMIYEPMDCGSRLFSHYGSNRIVPDDFSNLEKNFIVVMNLNKERVMDTNPKYTKEKIIETKNRIFGKDATFEIINEDSCYQFYLGEDGNYTVEWQCGGDMCSPLTHTKLSKAIQKGNKIYIDQLVIFSLTDESGERDENTSYYYQDYNRTKLLGKKKFIDSYDYMINSDKIDWNQYEKSASIYQYTYQVNEDGTYTFLQIEKIK